MKKKVVAVSDFDKNLREVKTAGFKVNKREKNTNRRAGLHDKKNKTAGETRVKRRKPLALKHVRRMRKAALALSCVFVGSVAAVGVGFFTKSPVEDLPEVDYATVCFETPTDGSEPTAHTLVENVGYMNYVLQNQPYWSSQMQSTVYTVMQQRVYTYKQYYNGVLISADIAQGVSSEATQFCVTDEVVLWRPAANKNFDGMNTPWSTKDAQGLTISQFKQKRGLPPSEFSVYILNEKTIKNAQDYSVIANADGTYTMTIDLNVNTGDGETSADYFYKQQMLVTGGLDGHPVIDSTQVTYVFDKDWRVLAFTIQDSYSAKMGISVHCTSETNVTFSYAEEDAKNSFYEDYFKKYEQNFVAAADPDTSAPNALNYLAAAFGDVLSEGATFRLDLNAGELDLGGVVHVGLENGALSDVRAVLGDIGIFVDGDLTLYVTDGNAKYKLGIGNLLASATDEGAEEAAETVAGLDVNAIIDQLTAGVFTVEGDTTTLDANLEIFGLDIALKFEFNTANGIQLNFVSAEIPLGGTVIKARLEYGTKEDIPALPADLDSFADIVNEGLSLDISLAVGNLKLDGVAQIVMDNGAFAGVRAELGDFGVYYDCPLNMLYLTDGNVKYKLSLSDISGGDIDLSGVLGSLDTDSLLSQIINNITTGSGSISTGATLEILEQTITAALGVQLTGGIEINADLDVLGQKVSATVGLTNEKVELPDFGGYVDILNEGITLAVDLTVENLKLNGNVFIGFDEGRFTELRADFGDIKIYLIENALYITDGVVKYKVAIPAGDGAGFDISALLGDTEGLLKQVLDSFDTTASGVGADVTLSVLEQTVKAALGVRLTGGIEVKATLEVLGKKVAATVGLVTASVELPDLTQYSDVLNEGLTLDVSLTLDEVTLSGKVYIGLSDGKLTELRADFGELKVYYFADKNELYIRVGTTKAMVALGKTDGSSAIDIPALFKGDVSDLVGELLGNLTTALKEVSTSANITLFDSIIPANATINIEHGIKVSADVSLLGIDVSVALGVIADNSAVPELNDKDEYIDVLKEGWLLADALLGEKLTATVSGNLYRPGDDEYAGSGYHKYYFKASLEYDKGYTLNEEGEKVINDFPVHIDTGVKEEGELRKGMNFYIDSTLYVHFNLLLEAKTANDESLYLDVYLMDATPVSSSNGRTDGGYVADGTLDVYVLVSKYAPGSNGYDPLKLYAPIDEIMTLVAMVGSAANLDQLDFKDSEKLTEMAAEISNAVNQLLIDQYIPNTKDQFASLGESLIPQLLNGKNLNDLLNGLFGKISGKSDDAASGGFRLDGEYIKSVTHGADSLNVVLNSSAVYGTAMNAADDMTIELNRGKINGVNYLTDARVNNIFFGDDNEQKLNIAMELSYGEINKPETLGGYTNLEGLDTLLKAVVNSATHETENGNTEYELNDYYLLNGNIHANINVVGIKVGVDVNVKSLAVHIDENNKVSVDAHIYYDGVQAINQVAINGDTDVYLTIKEDMIYIRRVQYTYWKKDFIWTSEVTYDTPVVETRVMPVSAFAEDIMDNICFMFNFGSLIADQLNNIDASGGNGGFGGKDLGAAFSYIIDYYKYSETETKASWELAISSKMLSDFVGMTMSNVPITINADKNSDGTYTVKNLDIAQSNMNLLGSAVTLEFNGSLTYCNPHGVIATDGNGNPVYTDTSVNLAGNSLEELSGYSWSQVLGAETYGDIIKNINWNLLLADTGKTYLGYGNGSDLAVAMLRYERSTDTENNGSFEEFGNRQLVLYNKSNMHVYTYLKKPSLSVMNAPAGKTAVWSESVISDNGTLVLRALYDFTYTVKIDSTYQPDDGFAYEDGVWRKTVNEAYKHVYLNKDVIVEDGGYTYGIKGYSVTPDGAIVAFGAEEFNEKGELCYVADITGDVTYYAVWERVYAVDYVAEYTEGDETVNIGQKVYYFAGEKLSQKAPAVPARAGWTGEWAYDLDATVEAGKVYTVTASYTINSYSVNIISGVAVNEEGYAQNDSGNFVNSAQYVFGTSGNLPASLTSVSPAYTFGGIYDNEQFKGNPVTSFTVFDGDANYYVKWIAKTLTVTYKSDVTFGEAASGEKDENNNYIYREVFSYGKNKELANFKTDGREILGWFMQSGDGYIYYATSADLLNAYEQAFAETDATNIDITLWAVWYNGEVSGTISDATHNSKKINTWYVKGKIDSPIEGKSAEIAQSAGITVSMQIIYYVSKDGVEDTKDLNWEKTESVNADGTFEKTITYSTVGTGTGNYLGGKVTVTINGNGVLSDIVMTKGLYKEVNL